MLESVDLAFRSACEWCRQMKEHSRRELIRISLHGFGALVFGLPNIIECAQRANANHGLLAGKKPLNWDAFVEQLGKLAERQLKPNWDQKGYVNKVAALLKQMGPTDPALAKALKEYKHERLPTPLFKLLSRQRTFEVLLISFEKGDEISHHNHPDMTGVICCATGRISIQSYDVLPERPKGVGYLIKDAGCAVLGPGHTSSLTAYERNIHYVRAGSFCQIIDIFTPPYDDDRLQKSRWFDLDPEPYRRTPGIFHVTEKSQV